MCWGSVLTLHWSSPTGMSPWGSGPYSSCQIDGICFCKAKASLSCQSPTFQDKIKLKERKRWLRERKEEERKRGKNNLVSGTKVYASSSPHRDSPFCQLPDSDPSSTCLRLIRAPHSILMTCTKKAWGYCLSSKTIFAGKLSDLASLSLRKVILVTAIHPWWKYIRSGS